MSSASRDLVDPHDTTRLEEDGTASSNQSSTEPVVYQEDHARITPINDAAKQAFNEIANVLSSDPQWNFHARRFIHINEVQETNQNPGASSSDERSVDIDTARIRLTGYYRLNLAILPAKFANGWIIGAGRNRPTQADVDILISINGRRDNVRSRHARILYHRESRAPMIGALPKKAVLLNGHEIKDQAHVLSQSQGIVIGNLAYRLEFLRIDKASFKLRGYQFQTPQAAGAYGVVSACLHVSTGNLYAVKRVQRTMKSFGLVNTEVIVMEQLGKHPNVCNLVETFYSDGDGLSMGSSSVNDVYMVLDPWAPQSIADFAATHPTREQRLLAYHQGAQGIRHLHHSDIIHRDIKPANLLISSLSPLHVVVADFGHATSAPGGETSRTRRKHDLQNHMKGTISYLPPEIIALKDGTDMSGCWSKASDVFTYGVVGTELFHGKFSRSKVKHSIDAAVHRNALNRLNTSTALDDLLTDMIQWRAFDRPTMDQVLLKSLWPVHETPSSARKRKNTESTEN